MVTGFTSERSAFCGIDLRIYNSSDNWDVSFGSPDGTLASSLTIADGVPSKLDISSSHDRGTLYLQIQQNGKRWIFPCCKGRISLDDFHDGKITLESIGDCAKKCKVNIAI